MSQEGKPGGVFDCMVFLQAVARVTGPAAACLRLLDTNAITLFVSDAILREVRDVLARPSVRRKNPRLTDETVAALFQLLAEKADHVAEVPRQFSYRRDPKDEPYVNLALAALARYLVTRDKDLLDLMDETSEEGKDFRQRFPGLTILDPVAFLREVGAHGQGLTPPQP